MFKTLLIFLLFIGVAYAFENYPTVGYVSYYTYESCKREGTSGVYTASGEKFNENAFTCAMRHRDFGHYYKVTNLENKKSVIVKHNDFGPNKKLFTKGRIMDLSRKSFEQIANLDKGLIKVRIEKIK